MEKFIQSVLYIVIPIVIFCAAIPIFYKLYNATHRLDHDCELRIYFSHNGEDDGVKRMREAMAVAEKAGFRVVDTKMASTAYSNSTSKRGKCVGLVTGVLDAEGGDAPHAGEIQQ